MDASDVVLKALLTIKSHNCGLLHEEGTYSLLSIGPWLAKVGSLDLGHTSNLIVFLHTSAMLSLRREPSSAR